MRPLSEVERVAIQIAKRAPKKRATHVFAAQIPWSLIEELREAIEREITEAP